MTTPRQRTNRALLRARDAMDRSFAEELDVPALAALAFVSPSHFSRSFKQTFGETPHRYLQRRRVERAMFLLRTTDDDVTGICGAVGFASLGTFSRTFRDIVGTSPSEYRAARPSSPQPVPTCFAISWTRPSGDRAVSDKQGTPSDP